MVILIKERLLCIYTSVDTIFGGYCDEEYVQTFIWAWTEERDGLEV